MPLSGFRSGLELMLTVLIAMILLIGIFLFPFLLCRLGFHDYRVVKATNLSEGKVWEVVEVCRRPGCNHERTVTRGHIGRF